MRQDQDAAYPPQRLEVAVQGVPLSSATPTWYHKDTPGAPEQVGSTIDVLNAAFREIHFHPARNPVLLAQLTLRKPKTSLTAFDSVISHSS